MRGRSQGPGSYGAPARFRFFALVPPRGKNSTTSYAKGAEQMNTQSIIWIVVVVIIVIVVLALLGVV